MRRIVTPLLLSAGIGVATFAGGGVASAAAPCAVAQYTQPANCATTASDGGLGSTAPATASSGAVTTAAAPETAAASSLAFTGADVAATAAGGAGVILVGAALVRASRRRKH